MTVRAATKVGGCRCVNTYTPLAGGSKMGLVPTDVPHNNRRVGYSTMKGACDGRTRSMVIDGVVSALGEGFLGKLIVGAICGGAAWIARRPAEKAAIMLAVDARVNTLLNHMETEVKRATERCDEMAEQLKEERAKCDLELAAMRAEIQRHMAGPVAGYPTINIRPIKPPGAK